MSLSAGFFETGLIFARDGQDDLRADLGQIMVVVGVARTLDEAGAFVLGLRLGVIADGYLRVPGERHEIEPGFVGALALDWRALSAPSAPLTLTLGLQLAVAQASLTSPSGDRSAWTAMDVRLAVTASRTFWHVVTPYVSARLFGGPILWRQYTGSDDTHLQLAFGLGIEPTSGFSFHVEAAIFAEHGVFGGVSVAF